MFLISPSFGASGRAFFVIVALPRYLHLYVCWLAWIYVVCMCIVFFSWRCWDKFSQQLKMVHSLLWQWAVVCCSENVWQKHIDNGDYWIDQARTCYLIHYCCFIVYLFLSTYVHSLKCVSVACKSKRNNSCQCNAKSHLEIELKQIYYFAHTFVTSIFRTAVSKLLQLIYISILMLDVIIYFKAEC